MSTVTADGEPAIPLAEFFDDDGECRILEFDDGWIGFRRDDKGYRWIDTRRDDWLNGVRVGQHAVRETLTSDLVGGEAPR